jgi:hypothetical protein
MSWLKKGNESAQAMAQDEQEISARKNRTRRFWVKEGGEEKRITFVDGNLTKEGNLDIVTTYEHQLLRNGRWDNFHICTMKTDGACPICEDGDTPAFIGALTIINHTPYTAKNGKIYKDQRELFVCKRDTIKLLTAIAVKRGGLAGCTFDVVRVGDKAARVGSQFDFVEKLPLAALRGKYTYKTQEGKVLSLFTPLKYEEELAYLSPTELRGMGFGTSPVVFQSAQEKSFVETADEPDDDSIPFETEELPE